jgi:hypothetical protein
MGSLIAALLLSLSVSAADCTPVTESEGIRLQRCGNLSVLTLSGKPVDRAYHMGALLGGPLSREVVDYFSYKIFDATENSPGFLRGLFTLAYNQAVRLFHRATPPALAEEVDALAAGMGVDSIHLKRAITLPDAAAALNIFSPRPLPEGGCTSIALKNAGGHFVYGRNLDFAGVGLWDKHPLVTVVLPEAESKELKHAVFGADGVLFGGITGVNEAGISFAVQQIYTSDAGLSGVPMMLIGEMVLRQAHSLAEAEGVLRKYRPATLWTFVVTDLKTGEAMAVESSQRHFAARSTSAGALVQTNHVMNEEVRKDELISLGTKMNSMQRMKTAYAGLDALHGEPSVEKMAAILSTQSDPEGQLAAYRDILKAHTIQTIFLESAGDKPGKVYVSQDAAPAAGGSFVVFDFDSLILGGPLTYEVLNPTNPSALKRQRQRETSLAFHAYFDEKDIPKALALLAEHRTLDAALFRAAAKYQEGFFQEAVHTADEALANPRFRDEPAYIIQSVKWVKLASLLRLGKTADARTLAAELKEEKPENLRLRELAERVAEGRSVPDRLLKLAFEFFSGDLGGRPS